MNFTNRQSIFAARGGHGANAASTQVPPNDNALRPRGSTIVKVMQRGDLVIIYEGVSSQCHDYLEPTKIYQNKFGAFYHDDMIGKPFGSKIQSRCSNGWVYILEPTPELWTTALNV